jgi:hypothetical protein
MMGSGEKCPDRYMRRLLFGVRAQASKYRLSAS